MCYQTSKANQAQSMGMIAQGLGTLGYASANGVFNGSGSTGGSGIGNIVDTPAEISRIPAMSTVQNNQIMNGNSLQQFNRLSQFNNGVFQPNPFMQSIYRDWQLNNNSF